MTQPMTLIAEIDAGPDADRLILEIYRFAGVLQKRLDTQWRPFSQAEVERLQRVVRLMDFRNREEDAE